MEVKRKILVVDDVWANRAVLNAIFSKGFDVLEAGSGTQALEILEQYKGDFSAVILDVVMPDMNGHEVLRRMRARSELSSIPVLVVSGSNVPDNEHISLDLGAWDFVEKPFDERVIVQCVLNMISRNEVIRLTSENAELERQNCLEKERRYEAEHDKLTGLLNKNSFVREADRMIQENPSTDYLLVRFDINSFKIVNDLFGYAAGDELLAYIGTVTRYMMGENARCGRIDGDHFGICMPSSDFDAKVFTEEFTKRVNLVELDFNIVLCFGVCNIDNRKLSVNIYCDRALMAQSSVKGKFVKNYALYDDEMRQKLISEQRIISDMSAALKDNQFKVYFQPQYNHRNGRIVGAEALVRWIHPKRGIISPGDFIPVFENNGFITQLDEFVWDSACHWLSDWMNEKDGVPITISVNVSRIDLYNPKLIDILRGIIEKYNVPYSFFRLEITESAYVEDPRFFIDIVTKLRALGFIIEMDDFGSHYSSLNMLKDVTVDILKLDMRFLSGGSTDRGGSILDSVVGMAGRLGMEVIAEGVETKEQADFLTCIGCNLIQGFYYSKPVPVSEFEEKLTRNINENYHDELLALDAGTTAFERLLTPDSPEMQMFSNYVGACVIFEQLGNRVEFRRCNKRFDELINLDGEYSGDFIDILCEESKTIFANALEEAIHLELPVECIVHLENVGNRDFWLKLSLRAFANPNYAQHVFFAAVDDISEQVNTAEELRATIELLNITLGEMNVTVFEYDIERDWLSYQIFKKGCEPIRRTANDFGKNLTGRSVMHPDDRHLFNEMIERIRNGEQLDRAECRLDFDGTGYTDRVIKFVCLKNEHGKNVKIVARID